MENPAAGVVGAQAHGARVWLDGEFVMVEATDPAGHGALGSARVQIPLAEVVSVSLQAP